MKGTRMYAVIAGLLALHGVYGETASGRNYTAIGNAVNKDRQCQIVPDETYLYAKKDTCDLFLDIYEPAGNIAGDDCVSKPTVIFMFGGGFANGSRDSGRYREWFSSMASEGFRIVSIDYRLGLKDMGNIGPKQAVQLEKAVRLAVEDLFSATSFLIQNSETLGIDPDKIVACGSSAGAVAVMQGEYEICRRSACTDLLPEGFNYAGTISFAGGVISGNGKLEYGGKPCPALIFHGTDDKAVPYRQLKAGRKVFYGGSRIAAKYRKSGFGYVMYHYEGLGHEVSEYMSRTTDPQNGFLRAVASGEKICPDDIRLKKQPGSPVNP